jgi:hypothetical protein
MRVGRDVVIARVVVSLIVCAGAVGLGARRGDAPQAPQLPAGQQAYNAATRVTDPAAQLAARTIPIPRSSVTWARRCSPCC